MRFCGHCLRGLLLVLVTLPAAVPSVAQSINISEIIKQAEQGDAKARRRLGEAYRNGEGVPSNYAEASRWFRKAADQGDAGAELDLGEAYVRGQGVAMDSAEAARWYRKAAEQQYEDTHSSSSSADEAVHHSTAELIKKAVSGDAMAQYTLGLAYANGDGLSQNKGEAAEWFLKAAQQGLAQAQNAYGEIQNDAAVAVYWFRKAAEQGDATAQYNLAKLQAEAEAAAQRRAEELHNSVREALTHINQNLRSSHEFYDWLSAEKLSVSTDSVLGDKLIVSYDVRHQAPQDKASRTIHHVAELRLADLDIDSVDLNDRTIYSDVRINCKGNTACGTDNGEKLRQLPLFCKGGSALEVADYLKRILLITQGKAAPEIKHQPTEKEIVAYLQSNIAPSMHLVGNITGFNRRFSLEGDELVMRLDLRSDSPRTGHLVMRIKLSQLTDTVVASGSRIQLLCSAARTGLLNCVTDSSGDAFPHIEIDGVFNSQEVAPLLKRLIQLHAGDR